MSGANLFGVIMKNLPYWRVDDNLISVDFPQHKPDLNQMAVEIFSTAFPSVFGFTDEASLIPEGYEPPRRPA
jgi:hypothetical protein